MSFWAFHCLKGVFNDFKESRKPNLKDLVVFGPKALALKGVGVLFAFAHFQDFVEAPSRTKNHCLSFYFARLKVCLDHTKMFIPVEGRSSFFYRSLSNASIGRRGNALMFMFIAIWIFPRN
jgi:hypothetical protein